MKRTNASGGSIRKPTSKVVTSEGFPLFLAGVMDGKRKMPKEFALSLGISPQLLYMLLNGKRSPSASVRNKLGLETAYLIPGAAELIAPDQLKMVVVLKMAMSKMDSKAYAKHLGVHEHTLYTITAGSRLPSKSLIKKLELETVYRII